MHALRRFLIILVPACCGWTATIEAEDLVEQLFINQSYHHAMLSPDGRHMAFLSTHKGKSSLKIWNFDEKTYYVESVDRGLDINSFVWVDTSRIVYSLSQWNLYNVGLNMYSVETHSGRRLLDHTENKLIFEGIVDPLVHKPGQFVFTAWQLGSNKPSSLYSMNLDSGRITMLADNTGEISSYLVDPDGQPKFALEIRRGEVSVLSYSPQGEWIDDTPFPKQVLPVAFMPGGNLLLVTQNNAKGYSGIGIFDLGSAAFVEPTRYVDGFDVLAANASSIIRDNASGYAIGVQWHGQKPGNIWFEPTMEKIDKFVASKLGGMALTPLGYSVASRKVYFQTISDRTPPKVVSFDMATGEISLVFSQLPDADTVQFHEMQPVTFEKPDWSEPIHGYLTKPDKEGPLPSIVLLHGGPMARDTWGFDPTVQYLAQHGYAVLQINYRGSTGYGSRHRLKNLSQVAQLSVDDAVSGAHWLVKTGVAHRNRIAIMGGSFGGYMTMAALSREPGMWACGISYAGVYDLNKIYESDRRKGMQWYDDLYIDYNQSQYRQLSPIHQVDRIEAPVFLIHGKSDQRVHVSHAKEMEDALDKAGKTYESLYIPWGIHGLPEDSDKRTFFSEIVKFLNMHLKQ